MIADSGQIHYTSVDKLILSKKSHFPEKNIILKQIIILSTRVSLVFRFTKDLPARPGIKISQLRKLYPDCSRLTGKIMGNF